MSTNMQKTKLAQALGANRVHPLNIKARQGPLGLLALREEITSRLLSTGGRPTDSTWTLRRGIPFKRATWERLANTAREMSTQKRKVTAAQLAASLVERAVETELVGHK